MNDQYSIVTEYYDWLVAKVYDASVKGDSYWNLLFYLLHRPFYWPNYIPLDENRAVDGLRLRDQYTDTYGGADEINEALGFDRCSWLEMMIALCIRLEDEVMSNSRIGNRTGDWFWAAITNLGLNHMTDRNFNADIVDACLQRFESRDYNSDGSGGGMYVLSNPLPDRDMRGEIWYQLNWYMTEVLQEEGIL